jgi:uncharacterized secreted protein with C-terminal beta-propeller domain
MSDITTVSTDATALELLITEFADASNELDRIFAECHAAHGIAALKPEGVSQTDYLKAQGKAIALKRATALYPNDPEMAETMASIDGRKPGATAVSHTALLQRAKAWEYALYMGDSPSSAVVAATFRLASASGAAKDAREKFEKDMKSASIKGVSEEDFQKAALDAAKSVPAPAGGASGNGGAQAEPEMDVNLALKALAWLAANSAVVTGDDRERVLAQARALSTLYKK